ncbi:MAG: hypothetical protein LUD81_03295, partial [Clostridiales bacterium]|nr:hypothetical protein [Clostridiales bacterium]
MIHLKGRSTLKTRNINNIKNFYSGIIYVYDKYYKDKHGRFENNMFHFFIKLKYYMTILGHYILGGK